MPRNLQAPHVELSSTTYPSCSDSQTWLCSVRHPLRECRRCFETHRHASCLSGSAPVMSGFTPEEERRLAQCPDNMLVFERLRDLPSPLRLADMPASVRQLGFTTEGVIIKTFKGAPMRHREVQIGNFFLGEKEGGREFTDEDEEPGAGGAGRGSPSARGWWRPTGAASRRRAAGRARARGSRSRFRRSRRVPAGSRPACAVRARLGLGRRARAFSSWTTIRRPCATFGTRSWRWATPRW